MLGGVSVQLSSGKQEQGLRDKSRVDGYSKTLEHNHSQLHSNVVGGWGRLLGIRTRYVPKTIFVTPLTHFNCFLLQPLLAKWRQRIFGTRLIPLDRLCLSTRHVLHVDRYCSFLLCSETIFGRITSTIDYFGGCGWGRDVLEYYREELAKLLLVGHMHFG